MNKANTFDMVSRTIGDELPNCSFYDYNEDIDGYLVVFNGTEDDISKLPVLLDIVIDDTILVGSARLQSIHKNTDECVAHYHAYAVHRFSETIPV